MPGNMQILELNNNTICLILMSCLTCLWGGMKDEEIYCVFSKCQSLCLVVLYLFVYSILRITNLAQDM